MPPSRHTGVGSRYNPAVRMALTVGTRLGPYEVTAPIGAGGMGEVYKATDTRLHRTVAVKVLPDQVLEIRQWLEMMPLIPPA